MPPESLRRVRELFQEYLIKLNSADPMKFKTFDLSLIYPEKQTVKELLEQVDDLKKCLDSFRPLNPEQLENLEHAFDIQYTHESTKIEGNSLTLSETALVIEKGITVKGKPLKDHIEVVNHQKALEYVKLIAVPEYRLNENDLLKIHDLILRGIDYHNAGKYRSERVLISGSRHIPPNPFKIYDLMKLYFEDYEREQKELPPVLLATKMHEKLVKIHPFIDGNGRTARLVMNLLLIKNGYPVANILGESESRTAYCDALEKSHVEGDSNDFQKIILNGVKQSLFNYLDMVADPEIEGKGAYFYKKIEPFLKQE
jgi:Fic family protein